MRGALWTDKELQLVRENYPEHGGDWDGWAAALPGRSPRAIYRKANDMGVFYRGPRKQLGGGRRWSPEEEEILKKNYYEHGPLWEGWEDLLPGRNYTSIANKASLLGISHLRKRASSCLKWTAVDDAVLEEHYPANGPRWSGWKDLLPGRTIRSITARAHALQIKRDPAKQGQRRPETFSRRGYVVANQHTGMWDAEQLKQLELLVKACPEVTGHTAYESAHMMLQMLEV